MTRAVLALSRGCAARRVAHVAAHRAAAAVLGVAIVLAVVPAAPAQAGTFRVSQCNAVDQGGLSPRRFQGALWWVSNGWHQADCGSGGGAIRIGTANWRLPHGGDTRTYFDLPASMPATSMREAWLDWRLPPQSPSTNPARLYASASGTLLFMADAPAGTAPGAAQRYALPDGARGLQLQVWCSPANGPGWCNWSSYHLELRGLTVELEEHGQPAAAASGALLAAGAHAGVEPLVLDAADGDSGVRRVTVSLGGTPVGSAEPAAGCRDDLLPPCPQVLRATVDVDTRSVADGAHRLRLAVTDAAGNVRVVDAGTVVVANQPSGDAGPGSSPGTGSAPGAGSGAGSGTGSDAPGPGGGAGSGPPALFPPNPLAGRGGRANGYPASERARVDAWLEPPARGGGAVVRRQAVTVPYGVRVRVRGRLTDEHGRPIRRAAIATVRREAGGEWRAVTGVRTRPDGRFTTFTRIGRSHELRFVYYASGESRRGRRSRSLHVRVRSR